MTLREFISEYGDKFKIFIKIIKDFVEQFFGVLQGHTSILDLTLGNIFIMLFCTIYFIASLWDGYNGAYQAFKSESTGQIYALTIPLGFIISSVQWWFFAVKILIALIFIYPLFM